MSYIDADFMNELVSIEKRLKEMAEQADKAGCISGPGWLRDAKDYIERGRNKIWLELNEPLSIVRRSR